MSIDPTQAKREEEFKYQSVGSEGRLNSKKVLVIVTEYGGFGDASCAYKIMRYLVENGGIAKENIAWINMIKEYGDFFDPEHQFKAKYSHTWDVRCDPFTREWNGPHRELLELVEDLKKEGFTPDLLLLGPAPSVMGSILKKLDKFKVPVLPFVEYGGSFANTVLEPIDYPRHVVLGVKPKEMGIHIDTSLFKWSEEEVNRAERLKELKKLPKKVQVAILGAPYSEETVNKFQESWQLFFGYASGATGTNVYERDKQAMCMAYAKMAYQYEKSSSNLCLFFLGSSFKSFSEENLQELKALGVAKISWPLEKHEIVLAKEGKEIKIINSVLKPAEVHILLRASEDEVLTTGDQFFSECVSSQKHFIYQTLPHKYRLLRDLEDQATEIDEEFGKLFKEAHTTAGKCPFSPDGVAKLLYKGRVDKKIAKAWRAYTTHLCKDCRLGNKFTDYIKTLLLHPEAQK